MVEKVPRVEFSGWEFLGDLEGLTENRWKEGEL